MQAFSAAIAAGVDLVELDVLDLDDGSLVVAHSRDLSEVSHGTLVGTVDGLSLAELRRRVPSVPTLDETLEFFVSHAGDVGLLVDLKLQGQPGAVAAAINRFGLATRTVISSPRPSDLGVLLRTSKAKLAFTYPDDRHGISRRPAMAPLVRIGLRAMKHTAPRRVPPIGIRGNVDALSLHHRVISDLLVDRAHRAGIAVLAWTVDTRPEIARVLAAGVDGIVTNDPKLLLPDEMIDST